MNRPARRAATGRFVAAAALARTPSEGLTLALVLLCAARGVSTAQAGLLVAATSFPQVLSGPLLGPRLDRAGDRTWRAVRVAAATTAAATLGLAASVGHVPLVVPLALACAVAAAEPTFTGGISAVADRATTGDDGAPGAAHAWDSVSYNVAGLAGPALVTALAVGLGAATSTAALAVMVLGGAMASFGLRAGDQPARGDDRPTLAGVRAGVTAIRSSRRLRASTVATTVAFAGFGGVAFAAVAAAHAAGRSTNDAGLVLTSVAVGGLIGSLAMTRRAVPADPERVVSWTLAGMGAVLVAMAAAPWPAVVGAALVLGALDGPLLVGLFASRVVGAPVAVRTTVFTVGASAKLAASALGAVVAGRLLDGHATGAGFAVIGAVHLVAALLCAGLGVAR
jgi:predicted MFS family arabinose efflux permease